MGRKIDTNTFYLCSQTNAKWDFTFVEKVLFVALSEKLQRNLESFADLGNKFNLKVFDFSQPQAYA